MKLYYFPFLLSYLQAMDISIGKTTTDSSNFRQYIGQMAKVRANAAGMNYSDDAESLETDSESLPKPSMEYVTYLQQKSNCIHNFINTYAKEGTRFRKSLDKAASSSESESTSRRKPRSLSKTEFHELLDIIGKAASQMEEINNKNEKENALLKKLTITGTACGSCIGAFIGACVTAAIAAAISIGVNNI